MNFPKLLSTKVLQPAQRSRLLAAGFAVQSYNAVQAKGQDFDMPAVPFQAIFTSQHAVQAFLAHPHLSTAVPILEVVYCVGEQSAQQLRKKGIRVLLVADSAAALAAKLFPTADPTQKPPATDVAQKTLATDPTQKPPNAGQEAILLSGSPVYYFCGNQHLKTLPQAFVQAAKALEILVIYKTQAVATAFETAFEVLFFYSPSGVKAFCENNAMGQALVVAIGPTTAAAVALHTPHYVVAKRPSFAHMLSALRLAHAAKKDPPT